jgi:UDP-2-acetamido-2-deoxy-ribo-hexuluronate aminotransferase
MQFIDLQQGYQRQKQAIDGAIARVLEHGRFVHGPEIASLEQQLASFVGVDHCIACSDGTMALSMALLAVGVQPGDEVITTAFSFFATAEVIASMGAVPVFVDINPQTYNMDVEQIEAAITTKTKAIMPVSIFGQTAELRAINAIAKRFELAVIEDAAQSLGATHHGQSSCGLTTIATTSFFPAKPLGCFGDGGACFTHDANLAEVLRQLRNHGQTQRYLHGRLGFNSRLDTLQAAILLQKLTVFNDEIQLRQQVAAEYDARLGAHFKTPTILPHNKSVYAQYTIEVEQRDALREALTAAEVPTAVHYPLGLHQQPAIKGIVSPVRRYPVTEAVVQRVLSLPFHPYLKIEEIDLVCQQLLALQVKVGAASGNG